MRGKELAILRFFSTFLFQLQVSSHIVKYFERHIQQMNK